MKQHRFWAWASLACMALALYTGRKRLTHPVGNARGLPGSARIPDAVRVP